MAIQVSGVSVIDNSRNVIANDVTANVVNAELTGAAVSTSASGLQSTNVDLAGLLKESCKITAGKLSNNQNINLEDGMVHLFTTQESTTSTPNLRYNGSTTLNSKMDVGEAVSVTLITTADASAYCDQLTIDGTAATENWVGGEAPSDGGASGVDIYTYTVIKTAADTFTVIAAQAKTA